MPSQCFRGRVKVARPPPFFSALKVPRGVELPLVAGALFFHTSSTTTCTKSLVRFSFDFGTKQVGGVPVIPRYFN